MVSGYFLWWYGEGFIFFGRIVVRLLKQLIDWFSLPVLVRTWVAPWKSDVLNGQNLALDDTIKLWEQNFASRLVGVFMRTIVIFVAVLLLVVGAIVAVAGLAFWLIVPPLYVTLPVLAGYIAFWS